MVVTAAHCIFERTNDQPPQIIRQSLSSLDIRFGEDQSDPEFEIEVESCVEHPDGEPVINPNGTLGYNGVDMAYCILDESPPVPLPLVPPMVPDGCTRDWLSRSMRGMAPGRPLAIAAGMGCEDVPPDPMDVCEISGRKRFLGVEIGPWFSDKKFALSRFGGTIGMRDGDSGGPLYIKLPDSTWRLIGVNSTTSGDVINQVEIQSVPPYLAWIEWNSGRDITPCHTRTPGTTDYVFTGGCEGMLALDPGTAQVEWGTGCEVAVGGPSDAAADECAEWPVAPTSTLIAPSL